MRTAPERTTAPQTADHEAEIWLELAREWRADDHRLLWDDVPAVEAAVVGHHDPEPDLRARMRAWGYEPAGLDLSNVALFAAGLARAEARAWEVDRPHVATKAYADRRFLLGDRILHWAVPWFDMVERCYPLHAPAAQRARCRLLETADRLRPAPALAGTEGLVVPGFDGFGPVEAGVALARLIVSVWSGAVISVTELCEVRHASLTGRRVDPAWLSDDGTRRALAGRYRDAAARWDGIAAAHPGSAQLWRDLALRAVRTARILET